MEDEIYHPEHQNFTVDVKMGIDEKNSTLLDAQCERQGDDGHPIVVDYGTLICTSFAGYTVMVASNTEPYFLGYFLGFTDCDRPVDAHLASLLTTYRAYNRNDFIRRGDLCHALSGCPSWSYRRLHCTSLSWDSE
ncbi:hypothetical protein OSTOST_14159, partial [Ostertagia ostertagi]